MEFERKQELIEFLRENLVITIGRYEEYYSNPHLEVNLILDGETISTSTCTIYDGDRNEG